MTTPINRKQFNAMYPGLPRKFWPVHLLEKNVGKKDEDLWVLALADKLSAYKRIPPKLRLRKGNHLQPPRFLYGWLITHQDLLNFVNSHKLPIASDTDMHKKVFGLSMTVVTKGICGVLRRERPDAMAAPTVNVSLEAVLLGGTPQQPKSSFCIAIADAYKTGNRLPAMEHVRALASFFDFPPDGVRWYLDALRENWIQEDSAEYTSWRALV